MPFTILPKHFEYDFIKACRYAYVVSSILFIISIGAIYLRGGIPLGVDFQGGSFIQFRFANPIEAQAIRDALEKTSIQDIVIQAIGKEGKEYTLRFSNSGIDGIASDVVYTALVNAFPQTKVTIELSESVGSKVSEDIRDKALEALYYSLLIIAVYISGRFEDKWGIPIFITAILSSLFFISARFALPILYVIPAILFLTCLIFVQCRLAFALGTILSLLHDTLLTCGLLVVCGISFDLSIVAGLLAILGYSLNDTIIVYDRIREYIQKKRDTDSVSLQNIINTSISSTLSRTLLTSMTTLLVLIALLIFGGSLLFPFALTITIGICVGTWSSIFIASPILLFFDIKKREEESMHIDTNGVV